MNRGWTSSTSSPSRAHPSRSSSATSRTWKSASPAPTGERCSVPAAGGRAHAVYRRMGAGLMATVIARPLELDLLCQKLDADCGKRRVRHRLDEDSDRLANRPRSKPATPRSRLLHAGSAAKQSTGSGAASEAAVLSTAILPLFYSECDSVIDLAQAHSASGFFLLMLSAIQRSSSERRKRQVPPSLNAGISPFWARR